jgi:hypothetical protein
MRRVHLIDPLPYGDCAWNLFDADDNIRGKNTDSTTAIVFLKLLMPLISSLERRNGPIRYAGKILIREQSCRTNKKPRNEGQKAPITSQNRQAQVSRPLQPRTKRLTLSVVFPRDI